MIELLKNAWKRLDWQATDGLNGVEDSLAYRVNEIERHHHSYERWFEAAAVPDGEIHVADRVCEGGGAFQANAGNDNWGSWLQILGSADTPEIAGSDLFDLRRIVLLEHQRNNARHCIQIGFGLSGAAALSAGTITEIVIRTGGGNSESPPENIRCRRQTAGTKAWLRIRIPGQNLGTLDFVFGLHEYEG